MTAKEELKEFIMALTSEELNYLAAHVDEIIALYEAISKQRAE